MSSKVILICGPMGSGKSTASGYLEHRHHALVHRFSAPLFSILIELGMQTTRENLSELSRSLRKHFGEDIMGTGVKAFLDNHKGKLIVLEGVRRTESIDAFRDSIDHIVWIESHADVRFERIRNRGEKNGEVDFSRKEFDMHEEIETEKTAHKFRDIADVTIENNRTEVEFYHKLDQLIH